MSRSSISSSALVFAWIASLAFAGAGPPVGGPDELEKKRAELAEVEEKIASEIQKIERRYREDLEKHYELLTQNDSFRAQLAKGFEAIAEENAGAITEAQREPRGRERRILEKKVDDLLDEEIGRFLSKFFRDTATRYLIELFDADERTLVGRDVVEGMTLDFEDTDFEGFFEKHRADCFTSLARLREERRELAREVAELEEIAEAKKAGVPPGMVRVPAGEHRIGIDEREIAKLADKLGYGNKPESLIRMFLSAPAFEIELPEFYIDKYEVTCEWYAEYLKANPGATPPVLFEDAARRFNLESKQEPGDEGYVAWRIPNGYEKRPVTGMSLLEAQRFAAWMGRRIPTEFEWEAAARFGTSRRGPHYYWSWGDEFDIEKVPTMVNIDLTFEHPLRVSLKAGVPPVLPVGTFQKGANQLDLHDMIGNASELTSSPFVPYEGFRERKIGRATLLRGEFNDQFIVVRGGDCLKRDAVATSVWRNYMSITQRADLVGFRTAASATRGLDAVNWVSRDGELNRFYSDIGPLPGDEQEGRRYGVLATEDPEQFSAVMRGGFDPEKKLPTRAEYVLAINRKTEDIRNMNMLRGLARDEMVCLGYLKVDVPVLEPKLEPGDYFVYWQNEYLPEEPEGGDGEKGEEGAEEKEPEPVPEAFVFVLKSKEKTAAPVRLEKGAFIEPVTADKQPTRVVTHPARDMIEIVYSFPTTSRSKNFVVSIPLRLQEGVASQFE